MKKILFIATLVFSFAVQTMAAPRLVMEDKKENYTQTETGYILNVKLICTPEELTEINSQVQNLADRLSIQFAEGSNGTYDCVITVDHQNQPEYVHKMLLAIGIADIEYKGEVRSLDAVIEILYSFL